MLVFQVQGPQSGHLPSTSSPINLEVYRKPEDTSVLAGLQGVRALSRRGMGRQYVNVGRAGGCSQCG